MAQYGVSAQWHSTECPLSGTVRAPARTRGSCVQNHVSPGGPPSFGVFYLFSFAICQKCMFSYGQKMNKCNITIDFESIDRTGFFWN